MSSGIRILPILLLLLNLPILKAGMPVWATLHGDACTSVNIHWLEKKGSQSEFSYRQAGESEWTIVKSDVRAYPTPGEAKFGRDLSIFVKRLEGLTPAKRYELKIPGRDRSLSITTQSTDGSKRRFLQGGDMMHRAEWMKTMTSAIMKEARKQGQPDFALLGGDYAYADGLYGMRWLDWLEIWFEETTSLDGQLLPMILAIGNHEVDGAVAKGPKQAPFFYALFHLPENRSYYTVDIGSDLSIIVLDSYHTRHPKQQAPWLDQVLTERANRTHLFACYHMPAYGSVKVPKHSKNPMDHGYSMMLQAHFVPHFVKHGVDWVFEHDHHTYKRTHPMSGRKIVEERGVIYIGDGSWGVELREPVTTAPYLATAKNIRHAMIMELTPKVRSYVAVDDEGNIFDRFEQSTDR